MPAPSPSRSHLTQGKLGTHRPTPVAGWAEQSTRRGTGCPPGRGSLSSGSRQSSTRGRQNPLGTPTRSTPVRPRRPSATSAGPGGGGDTRRGLSGGGGDGTLPFVSLSLQSDRPKPDPISEPGSQRGAGSPPPLESFTKSRPDLPVVRAVTEVVLWGRGFPPASI